MKLSLQTPEERRLFLKYLGLTLIAFSVPVTIQFIFLVEHPKAANFIVPAVFALLMGGIIGWNAILRLRLEKSTRVKIDFIAGVSHELRTPLTIINGFARILTAQEDLDPKFRDFANRIYRSGEHLTNIINDLLDMSHIETGKLSLKMEAADLKEAITFCTMALGPQAQERNIQIIVDAATTAHTLFADKTRLNQVLLNLISNAIKYNHRDGGVRIYPTRPDADTLRVNIEDSGPGIPLQRQTELFKPFSRLGADHSQVKGTGLGLVITKQLVTLMGGRVGVVSEPGSGSCFWIELRLNDAPKVG